MRTILFRSVIAAAITASPGAAVAQRGHHTFDLFLQGAQQELYRQQQLEHERQRRQELSRQQQFFLSQWHACFQEDLGACEQALAYPHLNFNDGNASSPSALASSPPMKPPPREPAEIALRPNS